MLKPVTPLDSGAIKTLVHERTQQSLSIDVLEEIDSTNRYLWAKGAALTSGNICLAETQHAGRGRRGHAWIATPRRNLLLSVAWRFETGPAALTGLGLAAGLAVLRALETFGVGELGLKWPNDILWGGRKLCGLLAEVQGETQGPAWVVIGVGINGYIAAEDKAHIDQPCVDLNEITGQMPDRNRLAALVIEQLLVTFRDYETGGFARFHAQWEERHLLQGCPVRVCTDSAVCEGTVVGVSPQGALRVRDNNGSERAFHSGEISVREKVSTQ